MKEKSAEKLLHSLGAHKWAVNRYDYENMEQVDIRTIELALKSAYIDGRREQRKTVVKIVETCYDKLNKKELINAIQQEDASRNDEGKS